MNGQGTRKVEVTLVVNAGKNELKAFDALKTAVKEVQDATDAAARKAERLYGTGATADIKRVATEAANRANRAYETGFFASQERLTRQYAVASQLGFQGVAGSAARMGVFAQGLEGIGMTRAGAALSRAALPLAIAKQGTDTSAEVAKLAYDPYLTDAQRARRFAQSIPGMDKLVGWADAFTGRAAAMQEVGLNRQRMEASRQMAGESRAFDIRTLPMMAGMGEMARQFRTGSAILGPNVDRTTAAGELEFRQRSRLLPIEREIAAADRIAAAAAREKAAAENQSSRTMSEQLRMTRERDTLLKRVKEDNTSGPEREQMLADLENVNKSLEQNVRLQQSAADAVFGASQKQAAAQQQAQQARAQLSEQRAANLEERAGIVGGLEQRLGGMNIFEEQFGVEAVRMVKEYGPRGVPPEVLAAARQIAPEPIAKIEETFGATTRGRAQLAEILPGYYGKESSEQLRREAQRERDTGAQTSFRAEGDFAAAGATAGSRMAEINARAFGELLRSYQAAIEVTIRQQKGQQ